MDAYPGHVTRPQGRRPFRGGRVARPFALLALLVVTVLAGLLCAPRAYAEGSVDLTENGGYRAYTERYGASTAGVPRLSVMKVYLKQGETLYLGSSVSNAQLRQTAGGDYLFSNDGMGTSFTDDQLSFLNDADIRICSPSWDTSANPDGDPYVNGQRDDSVSLIDIPDTASSTTAGYISDRSQEAVGPADHATGGYACAAENAITSPTGVAAGVKYDGNTFVATQTGVYTVVFYSTGLGTTNPTPALTTEAWDQKDGTVAAWDISVYDASGVAKTGRVFTDALFLNMGVNKTGTDMLKAKVYPVTDDGYRYEVDFNGMDPYGFRFTCNNRGLLDVEDSSVGTSLYHSVKSDNNQLSDLLTHFVALNATSTSSLDEANWIFYNEPDDDALTALGIPVEVTADEGSVSNFTFAGNGDATADEGYVGYGGTFSFDASSDISATSYQIELDFGNGNVVTLSNALAKGETNSIYWDGKDANGDTVPAGTYGTVDASIELKGGEVHFPLLDVENNRNGIIVKRLNGGGTDDAKATVHYNDSASNAGDATSPWTVAKNWTVADGVDASDGIVSTTNSALSFSNNHGDETALDVWAYYGRSASLGSYSFRLVDASAVTQTVPPITKSFLSSTTRSDDKTFTFDLTASDTNPTGAILPRQTTATITDADTNQTPFGDITFVGAGTFTFYISEEDGGATGYDYDTSVYVYTVGVELDDTTSALKVTSATLAVKTDGDTPDSSAVPVDQVLFLNTYVPKAVSTGGIGVTKFVTSGAPTQAFTYALVASGNNPTDGVSGIRSTFSTDLTGVFANPFDDPDVDGGITFSKAGTYKFTCFEYGGTANGWTYDASWYTWTVVVEDADGQLVIKSDELSGSGGNAIQDHSCLFSNHYSAPSNPYQVPSVTKVVDGENPTDATFSFTITADTAAAPMPDNDTVTVTGSGANSFGSIIYTTAGTYVYTIKEVAGETAGYTYSTDTYKLAVTVDLVDDKLVPTGVVTKAGSTDPVDAMLFTNAYAPKATTLASPDVEKVVSGKNVPDSTFLVMLVPDEDNPQGGETGLTEAPVQIHDDDTLVDAFGTGTFSRAGTYTYYIDETAGDEEGYIYDGTVYAWTVVVTDTNGALSVTSDTIVDSSGRPVTDGKVTFSNSYRALKVSSASPGVRKVVTGSPSSDETFDFALDADAANPVGGVSGLSTTSSITGAGSLDAAFGTATFTKPGTYVFKITESAGEAAGYTYDSATYTWTVVADQAEGGIELVSSTLVDSGGETVSDGVATFTNAYAATVTPTDDGDGSGTVVPVSGTPRTGDTTSALPMCLLVAGAAATLGASVVRRVRRED